MATDMILSSDNPSTIMMITTSPPSSSSATHNAVSVSDDCLEDGCSICLEPFASYDPPTVTDCKHEYHLQCILEWSQRSTECPICCQLLVLKDPSRYHANEELKDSRQELLSAAKSERSMRSNSNIHVVHDDHEVSHDAPYVNDYDLEEQILQHFAAASSRARYVNRRRRQTSSRVDSLEGFPSVSFATASSMQPINSPEEWKNLGCGLEVGLSTTAAPASTSEPQVSPVHPSVVNVASDTTENRDSPVNHRSFFGQPSPDGPRRLSPSEFLAFSETVKSKVSAASARYKDSITKSTRGFKEKLLARNTTVKELGKGVQREMSAGIAGVARMIERFDLSSKRTSVSVPFSSSSVETPNLAHEGKSVEGSVITQSPRSVSMEITHDKSSDIPARNSSNIPARVEVSLI